jgi:PAS domain-containing protein
MHRMNHNQVVERRRNGRQPRQSAMTILKQLPAVVVSERIPVPVLAIAQDGTVLFANTAFSEMVGRASEEVLSLKFDEIFHLAPSTESPRLGRPGIGEHGRRVGPPGRLKCASTDEQVGADTFR